MVFEKTRTFVFLEIGILWSSLRIKFPNLRFEDYLFFFNIRKYGPKIFLYGQRCFCFVTNVSFFSLQKKLKMAKNIPDLAESSDNSKCSRPLIKFSEDIFCWQLRLFRSLLVGNRGKRACYTLLFASSWLCCMNL